MKSTTAQKTAQGSATGASWLNRYVQQIEHHRGLVLLLLVVISVVAGLSITRLGINASPYFISSDHPARQAEQSIRQHFNNSGEQVFIAYVDEKNGVFTHANLLAIQSLSQRLQAINFLTPHHQQWLENLAQRQPKLQAAVTDILANGLGQEDTGSIQRLINNIQELGLPQTIAQQLTDLLVDIEPVKRVNSLFNTDDVSVTEDDITVSALLTDIPNDPQALQQHKTQILSNPIFLHSLISEDAKASALQLELRIHEDDSARMQKLSAAIRSLSEEDWGDARLHFSGPPIVMAQIADVIQTDNMLFSPLAGLVIGFILFISFRNWQGVVLPMAVSTLSTLWTFGVMAALDIEVNIVTTTLPVFLMTIAVADSIHFLSDYYRNLNHYSALDSARYALIRLFSPLLMTSITTVLGFIALANTNLVFVQHFGIFIALGVLFAFLITVTLLPCLLPLVQSSQQPAGTSATISRQPPSRNLIASAFLIGSKRPKLALSLTISLFLLCTLAIKDLQVDNNNIKDFEPSSQLRQDDKTINQTFGGTIPLNLWFSTDEKRLFTHPDTIYAIEQIAQFLRSQPEIGYVIAPSDLIKRMDQLLNEKPYELSNDLSQELIAQYYLLYENSESMQIRDLLDSNYSSARIMAVSHTDQSSVMKAIIDQTRVLGKSLLPESVEMHFAGFGNIMVAATHEVVIGQIKSMVGAIILISLIMAILFRSAVIAILGMTPLVLTILLNFALMSAFGFYIDIATALIAGIVFGIGVDYAIHFLATLKQTLATKTDLDEALTITITQLSRPITINSISLSLGFSVLIASSYGATSRLGMLVAMTMLICALLTLFLLPVLIKAIKPRKLLNLLQPESHSTSPAEHDGN